MIKPVVDMTQIKTLLREYFGREVEQLAPIGTGQIASAYSFSIAGQEYIVRFVKGNMAMSFRKDRFIASKLASTGIPVPPILHIGVVDDVHFAISRKVVGTPLDGLSKEDNLLILPGLMVMLDAIHHVDISDTQGYGDFDGDGIGRFASWQDFLLSVVEEEDEDGFYGKWHRMFDETFLDRDFFDYVYEKMVSLLKYCPSERYLVHFDYGYGNVLGENGRVTAVLDWANAVYGDFLFDIAWLDIGSPEFDFRSRFRQYYQEKKRFIPNYDERILCYQCFISLDSQRWYAKSNQPRQNEWMRDRIIVLLERSSH